MATHGTLYIKSNDGTADAGTLAIYDASGASLITVTATGATSDFSGADAYTYGGNKEFLGFAEVANATEPTYAIGDTFYASGRGTVYIVEAEEPTTSGVTVEYDGSVVATIPSGNKATIPIADKKMKTDIVITVPEAEGGTDSPLPTEVSTEAEMTALLTSGEVGGVYKYTGTTGTYENGALYVLEEEEAVATFSIVNPLNGATLQTENASGATVTHQYQFSGGSPVSATISVNGESSTIPDTDENTEASRGLGGWAYSSVNLAGLLTVDNGSVYYIGPFSIPVEVSFTDGVTTVTDSFIASGYAYECFVEGTRISLANGTTKAVEDITYDDELLVWDFYNGDYATAKPSWIMVPKVASQYKLVTLSNGTELRLVGSGDKCHRLFNVTKQKMLYANECVGDEVFTESGIATVVSCVTINETVNYYNLTTEEHYCCFAEGVLTGSRLNNMYHISDMKYDSDERLISDEEVAERWAVREATRLKI